MKQRRVKGNDVAGTEDFVQRQQFDTQRVGHRASEERIVHRDLEIEWANGGRSPAKTASIPFLDPRKTVPAA